MGSIVVKNVVSRKPGYLYYRFFNALLKPVPWMGKEMFVRLRCPEAERRNPEQKRKQKNLHLKREDKSSLFFSLFLLNI